VLRVGANKALVHPKTSGQSVSRRRGAVEFLVGKKSFGVALHGTWCERATRHHFGSGG
jgi:hypothetical protein